MDESKRLPLPVRSLLVNLAGLLAGLAVGWAALPEVGDFADAFRPYLIAAAGIIGLILSGLVTAWLCMREP